MDWLIIPGAILTLVGLLGIIVSAVKALKARRAGLEDDALRAQLKRVMLLNMGALFVSVIGLMLVILGIFLA